MSLEALSAILEIAVGVGAAVIGKWVLRIKWRWLACGAALWFIAALEKWQIDALLHRPVLDGLESFPQFWHLVLGSIYIGLLTGITEVALTLVAGLLWPRLARTARRAFENWNWRGAFEAVFFGVQAALHPPETTGSIFAPAVERIIVIVCHTVVRAMVLYAVATKRWRWFWLAFTFFTAIDALSGFYILKGMYSMHPWLIELSYSVFGIASIPILQYLWCNWPPNS